MASDEPSIFDRWAASYDRSVAGDSPLYARYGEVLRAVAAVSGVEPGDRALDLGTGTGNLALVFARLGARVIGLDPSAAMLAEARAKLDGARVRLLQVAEPFLNVPLEGASCHVVASTYAFHHVPHELKSAAVAEMVRVLKPGGTLALGDLAFATAEDEQRALTELAAWLEDEPFARLDALRQMLGAHGMALHAVQYTPVTWVFWSRKP